MMHYKYLHPLISLSNLIFIKVMQHFNYNGDIYDLC